jgi:hypothetical protein
VAAGEPLAGNVGGRCWQDIRGRRCGWRTVDPPGTQADAKTQMPLADAIYGLRLARA